MNKTASNDQGLEQSSNPFAFPEHAAGQVALAVDLNNWRQGADGVWHLSHEDGTMADGLGLERQRESAK
jgi:hypothetical protein